MNTNITTIDNYSFITLTNDKGFSVTLCDLGASIYSIIFNKKEMTFVPEDYSVFFKRNIYYGKTIGRISNRVKGNKVTIDRKDYLLENNEGENTLHGGLYGLSTKKFDYQIKENEEGTTITFTYLMKDLLMTGRHHQIRCQLAAMGCPIKGDLKYGAPRSNPDGSISLLSRRVEFIHPVSKEQIIAEAPLPDDPLWLAFKQ